MKFNKSTKFFWGLFIFLQVASLQSAEQIEIPLTNEEQIDLMIAPLPYLQEGFDILQEESLFSISFRQFMYAKILPVMNNSDEQDTCNFADAFDARIYDAQELIAQKMIKKFFDLLYNVTQANIRFQEVNNLLFHYVLQHYKGFMKYPFKNFLNDNLFYRYASFKKAIMNNNVQVVQFLINAEIDVNPPESLLYIAADYNNPAIVAMLIAAGADVNRHYHNQSPLFAAVLRNHQEVAEILLRHGANFNFQEQTGTTPLILAQRMNRVEIFAMMQAYFPQQVVLA